MNKTALIIGAGPAGLTAAYELLKRTDITPIVIEQTNEIGGISKTVNYKGNRIDIGGHRFFSKSDAVMNFWQQILPLQTERVDTDEVLLLRNRLSRIYFNKAFFDYPLQLSWQLLANLGLVRSSKIAATYAWRLAFARKPEITLEDFYINRFGDELYKTFFEAYTHKVWGVPCSAMSAEWGAQRAKGISVAKALLDVLNRAMRSSSSIAQKEIETSLITQFLYPKHGPGQLWEKVAHIIQERGGFVVHGQRAITMTMLGDRITAVQTIDSAGNTYHYAPDYVFSSMPVKDLIAGLGATVPQSIGAIAQQLPYRDFLTVGLLIDRKLSLRDNWIYIQDPGVTLGRVQIFNNWSPFMVAHEKNTWLGLEYFCQEGDSFWNSPDQQLIAFAGRELASIGLIDKSDVIDGTVLRVQKAYPGYWGTYAHFNDVRAWLDRVHNLFLIGRNGMHRYNNQDHSMLSAMAAVDAIVHDQSDKSMIWQVNAEKEYHEIKRA